MKLHEDTIFEWVETVARQSLQFFIVSPFFTLDEQLKSLLTSIPNLQIFVGDEFSTNDPKTLRELSDMCSIDVQCIYQVDNDNRLHAKVFCGVDRNGRRSALIGSSNFTVNGLTRNKEIAVSFDSYTATDIPILESITSWIDNLQQTATGIDWVQANRQFENSTRLRRARARFDSYLQEQTQNYWVLKTVEGIGGKCQWQEFVRERVISVGWTDLIVLMSAETGIPPANYTHPILRNAAELWARGMASKRSQEHAVKTIYWFCKSFARGDRIIICNGYSPNQVADVHLYGLAIVEGDVYDDSKSDWWRLKRSVALMRKESNIPKQVFVDALQKGSLRQTIHRISQERYEAFRLAIEQY